MLLYQDAYYTLSCWIFPTGCSSMSFKHTLFLALIDFQDFPRPPTIFKDFSVLENARLKFMYFPGFPGPVRNLLTGTHLLWVLSSLLFPYDFGLVKECTLCIPKYKTWKDPYQKMFIWFDPLSPQITEIFWLHLNLQWPSMWWVWIFSGTTLS